MRHRHLDYPEGTPADELGAAAIDDVLDRGDLAEWRPITQAVLRDPFGDVADAVLRLTSAHPRYGTSPLWRAWIAHRRDLASLPEFPERTLAELRQDQGMTQAALADRIGMSQSDLSKAERRPDWKLSTLRRLAAGLGLRVCVMVQDLSGRRWQLSDAAAPWRKRY